VISRNLVNGEALAHWGLLRQNKKKILANDTVRVIKPLRTKQIKQLTRKEKMKTSYSVLFGD
jgi:hypothetical protein